MSQTYECPSCHKVSHNPNDAKFGWCGACNRYGWAMDSQQIFFDLAVARLQKCVRSSLASGSPFSLQFEQFVGSNGTMQWRALIKLGLSVWKHSRREHGTPSEALCELIMDLEAKRD